jgi:hypothetical protein
VRRRASANGPLAAATSSCVPVPERQHGRVERTDLARALEESIHPVVPRRAGEEAGDGGLEHRGRHELTRRAELGQAIPEHRCHHPQLAFQVRRQRDDGVDVDGADRLTGDLDRNAELGDDARHGLHVVGRGRDVIDALRSTGPVHETGDAGVGVHAVEHLPETALRVAPESAALLQVHARHHVAASEEVVDRGVGGGSCVGGLGQAILKPGAVDGTPRRRIAALHGGPRRRWLAEEEPLRQGDVVVSEPRQLRRPFDAFGDDAGADLLGERHEAPHQRLSGPVALDLADQLAIELEEVGELLDRMLEAGVAGAGVVDGEADAARRPGVEVGAEGVVVGDRLLLGELEDEPLR